MNETKETIEDAMTWCVTNGVLMGANKDSPHLVKHAPFSLRPCPLEETVYHHAITIGVP